MGVLKVPTTFQSVEVKAETEDASTFNRWSNKDCAPVPVEQRNYTSWAFAGYWAAAGVNATAWALGSSNIAAGLSPGESIGMVLIGSFLSGLVAFVCGEPGVLYHLGFPMMSRATFGMYGSYFVIMIKCFVNFIFCGVQIYWGGLAVKVLLGSIFPTFHRMANTLPESAAITTSQLTGFILYVVVFIPILFIHPAKLQPFLQVAFFGVAATFLGMLIWALSANHGAGEIVHSTVVLTSSERSFLMLKAVSSVAGAWTGSSIRQSDWTRYAKTKRSPVWNQLLGAPLTITIAAMFGVFVTSATKEMYGTAIWNPIELLQHVLDTHYTAGARAGCFFGGLGFFCSQLSTNIAQNSVAAGMDLASLWPRYIDVTRGSLIMVVVAVVINPWRFVNSPGTFVTVLNSFGLFVAPLAGINVVDFWIIRRLRWNVPHLYIGDSSGIYWYTAGMNWRAFACWIMSVWPSLPGFASSVSGSSIAIGWMRAFQVTWFIGFLGGAFIYWVLCLLFPPPGAPYEKVLGNDNEEEVTLDDVKSV